MGLELFLGIEIPPGIALFLIISARGIYQILGGESGEQVVPFTIGQFTLRQVHELAFPGAFLTGSQGLPSFRAFLCSDDLNHEEYNHLAKMRGRQFLSFPYADSM